MNRRTCPPANSLLAFLLSEGDSETLRSIQAHVAECLACSAEAELLRQQVPEDLAFLSEPIPDVLRQMHRPRGEAQVFGLKQGPPMGGQIWAARSKDGRVRRLVLILEPPDDSELLLAALVSPEVNLASDRDVVFPTGKSPLEYPLIVETWNQFPLLSGQCFRYVGSLEDGIIPALRRLGRKGEWDESLGVEIGVNAGQSLHLRRFQLAEADAAKTLAGEALNRAADPMTLPGVSSSGLVQGFSEQISVSSAIPWTRQDERVTLDVYRCNLDLSGRVSVGEAVGYFSADHFVFSMSWDWPCMMVRGGPDKKVVARRFGNKLRVRFYGPSGETWGLSRKEVLAPTVRLTSDVEQEIPVDEALYLWTRAATK